MTQVSGILERKRASIGTDIIHLTRCAQTEDENQSKQQEEANDQWSDCRSVFRALFSSSRRSCPVGRAPVNNFGMLVWCWLHQKIANCEFRIANFHGRLILKFAIRISQFLRFRVHPIVTYAHISHKRHVE